MIEESPFGQERLLRTEPLGYCRNKAVINVRDKRRFFTSVFCGLSEANPEID